MPLKNIDAVEKDTVTFTCELSKPDRKEGVWTFKDKPVKASERFTIGTDGVTQTFTVANVTLDDRGAVGYSIQNVSTDATLLVEGKE